LRIIVFISTGSKRFRSRVEIKIPSCRRARSCPASNQQFVGEDAQAVHCRGFDSQYDWAERNWLAAMTPRERKLGRCKITLRPNQHQYASRTITVLARVGFQNFF